MITHYDTMCPTVVAAGNRSKSFLPSSIPLHVKQNTIKQLNNSTRKHQVLKIQSPALYQQYMIVIDKEYGNLDVQKKQSTYNLEFYGLPILLHSTYFLAKEDKNEISNMVQ
jgi:hypothetical protein